LRSQFTIRSDTMRNFIFFCKKNYFCNKETTPLGTVPSALLALVCVTAWHLTSLHRRHSPVSSSDSKRCFFNVHFTVTSDCVTLTYFSLLSALKVFLTYGTMIILVSNNSNNKTCTKNGYS